MQGNRLINQSSFRADASLIEGKPSTLAFGIELQFANERKAPLIGSQRAEIITKMRRQHRQYGSGEINASSSLNGRSLDQRARRDIVRNISNRDQQFKSCSRPFDIDGVIKIACIFAINRDKGEPLEITPLSAFFRSLWRRERDSRSLHFFRKRKRN